MGVLSLFDWLLVVYNFRKMDRNLIHVSFVGMSWIGHRSPLRGADGALGVSLPMRSGDNCVPSALQMSDRHSTRRYKRQLLKI